MRSTTHKVTVDGQPTSRVVVTSGKLKVVGVESVKGGST